MKLVNSWKAKNKQSDKFSLKLRLGLLTVIDIYGDFSRRTFGLMVFNFGIKTTPNGNTKSNRIRHCRDHRSC